MATVKPKTTPPAASMHTENSPGPPQPSTDRDSIYWSKERWRIIAQRLGPMSIQYLLIDSHHNEIAATYPKISEAMAHRDQLDPVRGGAPPI